MFNASTTSIADSRAYNIRDIILTTVGIVLLWQVIVWVTGVPRYILPGPLAVAKAWVDNASLIGENTWVTAIEVVAGLIIGTGFGAATALLLMMSALLRRFLMPVLILSQTIPVFALAPLLTLWLGYGLSSKIVMTILIIYFPVTSTFLDGLRGTPAGFLDLAQTMRSYSLQTLLRVRVPAALPSLTSGIRLASVYAPIGAIIGEWVGASKGLGYLMLLANGRVKTDLMFAALITLCVFTLVLRMVVGLLCRKIDAWAGKGA